MYPQPAEQPTVPAVHFTPDGHPYYAPAPAAPLVTYQPTPAPLPVYQPAYLATAPHAVQQQPAGYSAARDPWVARLFAGGIGIGAAGVGVGFLLQALTAATAGLAALAAVLALVWLLSHSSGGGRGSVNVRVSNRNR
ncbi:hypothetical protein ACEZCY_15370 [Streptacidiphilus sp. N1-12]|uniref:Uncharacterized protein n=2 Tax=Streptacidiphilus alkalitolerans TaxID=3342712 RepID=A0ABV6VB62_9ACTN